MEKEYIVNVLPCLIKHNGAENINFWKKANTRFNGEEFRLEKNEQINKDDDIKEDQFYAVYNEKKLQEQESDKKVYRAYFRGRKFYGESLNVDEQYNAVLFEKKNLDQSLLLKGKVKDIVLWEHEKLPSDSLKVGHGFQNQWYDIQEMIQLSDIIHS